VPSDRIVAMIYLGQTAAEAPAVREREVETRVCWLEAAVAPVH
jgi:hypothetical protein